MKYQRTVTRALVTIEAALGLLGLVVITPIYGWNHALAFLAGVILIIVNFLLLSLIWMSAESKKSVAWVVAIIVLKYPLLGLITFLILRRANLPAGGFAAGVATVMVAVLVFPLLKSTSQE